MGTVIRLTIAGRSEEAAREAAGAVFAEFERIDALMSGYREESGLSLINREGTAREIAVDRELFALLSRAVEISRESGGAFDVTVGPLVRLWRFNEGGRVPPPAEIEAVLPAVGYEKLHLDVERGTVRLDPGMALDLGAIAKGYAVDRSVEILSGRGVANAIVDAGGDIRLLGRRPGKDFWKIGIQHPRAPGKLLLSLDLADTVIVTSGDYERFFMSGGVRYHHLLNPRTGQPARGCRSVTVIGGDAAAADARATAAFVMGPEEGLRYLASLPGVEGIVVDAAGTTRWTRGLDPLLGAP